MARKQRKRAVRGATARRRRARRPRMAGTELMDPYVHCVYGPIAQVANGAGAPDGSTEPSIVIEHRQCLRILPSVAGNVTIAIVPSPYGAIAIEEGTCSVTVNAVDFTASGTAYAAPTVASLVATPAAWGAGGTSAVNYHYGLVPFAESLRLAGNLVKDSNEAGIQATQFRVLTTQARITYIGTDFENSGAAATVKIPLTLDHTTDADPAAPLNAEETFAQHGSPVTQQLPGSFETVCGLPGSRTFPITESCSIIIPPQDLKYQTIKNSWAPFYTPSETELAKDVVFGGILNVTKTGPIVTRPYADPIPGVGYGAVTFYAATGMQTTQPLLIEIRTCVEYTVAFASPMSRFTIKPALERPEAIRYVKQIARDLPSSFPTTPQVEQHGFLHFLSSTFGNLISNFAAGTIAGLANRVPVGRLVGGMRQLAVTATRAATNRLGYSSRLAIGM